MAELDTSVANMSMATHISSDDCNDSFDIALSTSTPDSHGTPSADLNLSLQARYGLQRNEFDSVVEALQSSWGINLAEISPIKPDTVVADESVLDFADRVVSLARIYGNEVLDNDDFLRAEDVAEHTYQEYKALLPQGLYTQYTLAALVAHSTSKRAEAFNLSQLMHPSDGLTPSQSAALERLEADMIYVRGVHGVVADFVTQTYTGANILDELPPFALAPDSSQ